MPSQRRVKAFGLVVLLTILITIYWTSAARQTRSSDFYTRTSTALREKEDAIARAKVKAQEALTKNRAEEDIAARLKVEEEKAKEALEEKGKLSQQVLADDSKDNQPEGGKSVAGRVKIKGEKEGGTPGVAGVGGSPDNVEKPQEKDATDEEREIKLELNSILKKGPIIIFSKSYCPYSRKAKHILLDLYRITPTPYVVELDEHPLGRGLQDALGELTNRHTVPNILINGLSIGGGDDIAAMHESGQIIDTITSKAGKRVTEVKLLEVEKPSKDTLRRRRKNT